MSWFFWIVVSIVATSVSSLLQRVLMKGDDSEPIAYTVVFLAMLTVITGAYAGYKGFVFPPLGHYWPNFLLSTILYAIGVVTWFTALQHLESSEATIISSFGTLVTVGTAIVFLGETVSVLQVVGVVLILFSIYLLNSKNGKLSFHRNSLWVLISSACYGLAATNDLYIISRGYDAVSFVPVMSIAPAVLLLLFRPSVVSDIVRLARRPFLSNMFIMTLLYSIQAIAYYVAYELGGKASQITPISKASIILTVVLATLLLNERKNLRMKFLSALAVTAGVLLIK